jgi:hypothetical protein
VAKTIAQMISRIRTKMGDRQGVTYTDAEIADALAAVIAEADGYFYIPVKDETTYAGSTSAAVPAYTIAVNVPSAFLASGERTCGEIFVLKARMWDGTTGVTPIPARIFPLSKGVWVDPLESAGAQIHFDDIYNRTFELFIYGGRPITPIAIYDFNATDAGDLFTPTAVPTGGTFTGGNTIAFFPGPGLPTGIDAFTRYFIRATGATFQVALTSGGAAVVLTSDGYGSFVVTSDSIEGTDVLEGWNDCLMWGVQEYLHVMRQTSGASDTLGHQAGRVLGMDRAHKLMARYQMGKPEWTPYVRNAGSW